MKFEVIVRSEYTSYKVDRVIIEASDEADAVKKAFASVDLVFPPGEVHEMDQRITPGTKIVMKLSPVEEEKFNEAFGEIIDSAFPDEPDPMPF